MEKKIAGEKRDPKVRICSREQADQGYQAFNLGMIAEFRTWNGWEQFASFIWKENAINNEMVER